MTDLHDGPAGGHYSGDTTAHKILRAGHYWPTLFKYAHAQTEANKATRFVEWMKHILQQVHEILEKANSRYKQ